MGIITLSMDLVSGNILDSLCLRNLPWLVSQQNADWLTLLPFVIVVSAGCTDMPSPPKDELRKMATESKDDKKAEGEEKSVWQKNFVDDYDEPEGLKAAQTLHDEWTKAVKGGK